jgi:hypothetical protein
MRHVSIMTFTCFVSKIILINRFIVISKIESLILSYVTNDKISTIFQKHIVAAQSEYFLKSPMKPFIFINILFILIIISILSVVITRLID